LISEKKAGYRSVYHLSNAQSSKTRKNSNHQQRNNSYEYTFFIKF